MFLKQVDECEPAAVILSVTQPFANNRSILLNGFPVYLAKLYNLKKFEHTSLKLLRQESIPNVTVEEQIAVEQETLKQSKYLLWFEFRAGRITASKFKSACRTKVENSSLSLIKNICYPDKFI